MTASLQLYHDVHDAIWPRMRRAGVGAPAIHRLILLVFGILVARSVVVRQIATRLEMLDMGCLATVRRRLQRTMADASVRSGRGYAEAAQDILAWNTMGHASAIVVSVDESSQDDRTHLIRMGVAYRGTVVPLAWALWEQNTEQPIGAYWAALDQAFARLAAILPTDRRVIVVADRAYDIPSFIDRVAARGWHWVVRTKTRGSLRFRGRHQERTLATMLKEQLAAHRGARWKATGSIFKKAGWRRASVVALRGTAGVLAVISDLPARWSLLAVYRRRFWIETGFRNDKSSGWNWEQSQVTNLPAQETLIVAMAWASMLTLCVGAQVAEKQCASPCSIHIPEHARESLFTLGHHAISAGLLAPTPRHYSWILPYPDAPTWNDQWRAFQGRRYVLGVKTVTP